MKLHRNAKTTPISRLAMVRRVQFDKWSYRAVAEGYGVSIRTVAAAARDPNRGCLVQRVLDRVAGVV